MTRDEREYSFEYHFRGTAADKGTADEPEGAIGFHPIADLFPLIEGAAFDELVADVRVHNKVREPVVIYQGLILDGRNRYRAAQAAGVVCPMRVYEGDDPIGLVVSANLARRHLDSSQRAMIAARLANMRQGERTDLPSIEGRLSQEQAAKLLNVGLATVERAKIVRDQGEPELAAAVERGDISVSGAVEQIRRGINTGVAMHPYAERGLDLYETPAAAVRALLEVEPLAGTIWEPACGPGAIVRVLRAAGHHVIATDIESYGCPASLGGFDFLTQTAAPKDAATVFTNPPFMYADEFVRRALTLVPRVVLLLRLAFLEGTGRSDVLDGGQLARVYVFRNRLPMLHRDGWTGPRTKSSAMPLAWFIWERDHRGPPTVHRISWSPDDEEAPPDLVAVDEPPPSESEVES